MKLRTLIVVACALAAAAVSDVRAETPSGQMTWGVHTTRT